VIDIVIEQRRRNLGGFEVGRVLPFPAHRMVGPFIFFDHIGPVDFPPGIARSFDVRPHPHIGLATVTYLFDGEIMHRDSVGSEQAIRPGEVNWMVAGRGITHSERFERARRQGDRMHGIQAWVALPDEAEETDPGFDHYDAAALPTFDEDGARGRLIAGTAYGAMSTVPVHSPMFYVHWDLASGGRIMLPDQHAERALYVASGEVEVGGHPLREGQMAVVSRDASPAIRATAPATVLAIGGEPVGERFIDWNFVSSRKERIEEAKADWRAGRLKLPDLDHDEFIPLPGE
jgi:redox-sensitive bicupin YhaK (pirin superfamily)